MTQAFNISGVIRGDAGPFKAAVAEAKSAAQELSTETGKGATASQTSATAFTQEATAIKAVAAARRDQAAAAQAARSAFSDAMIGNGQSMGGMNTTAMTSATASVSGVTRAVNDQAHAMVAAQREARNWQSVLNAVRAQHDPLYAASRQYEQELRSIAEAEKMGALSATQAASARDRAAQSLTPLNVGLMQNAKASGAATAANANLIAQWNDIGVMMAAGQNPMQLALQQGTQVSQVFASLGGGTVALRALGTSFLGMLNPMNLAIIGVIAFGAAGVQWLMKLGGETKSLEDQMSDLESTIGRLTAGLDRIEGIRLDERFGSMTNSVRGLTEDLIQLDRAAELKQMRTTLDTTLEDFAKPSLLSRFALGPGVTEPIQQKLPYEKLDVANSYEDFASRRTKLISTAEKGDVEGVAAQVRELGQAMTGGGPFSKMSEEAQKAYSALATFALKLAEFEAQFNGTALDAKRGRLADEMVRSYTEQVELARAIVQYGENSSEVQAVQIAQSRAALSLKLQEQGIDLDSARAARIFASFDQAQAAERAQSDQERNKALSENLTTMQGQIDLSNAILTFGRNGVEVERLRTEQAKATLRTRLEELGVGEDQIVKAETLLELERGRAEAVERAEAVKASSYAIADLQREAAVARASLTYGRDSLEVKRLQIDAAREEYRISLEQAKLTAAERAAQMQAWEQTRGLGAIDPFGVQAAASGMLRTRSEAIAKSQFELALAGQSEAQQNKLIALYDAEVEIRRAGIDVQSEAARAIREQTALQADLNNELKRQADVWGDIKSAGEEAIDGVVSALKAGDFGGALEAIAAQIVGTLDELAISNPLKNALLGSDYATIGDAGGLGGIWEKLTGTPKAPDPLTASLGMPRAVSQMQVTAANVTISGAMAMSLMGGGSGVAANLSGGLSGSADVQSKVWDFFRAKGLEPHQVAGIMGNISGESGFNPLAKGDYRNGQPTSFGLFQHHAGRADGLLSAVGGMGGLGNIDAQLEYAWKELQTSESAALQKLLASTNVSEASNAWMRGFERPSEDAMAQSWPSRLGAAEEALQRFGTTAASATGNLGTLGTGFDAFGNALAQGLNGLGSGGAQGGLSGFLGSLAGGIAGALGIPGFAAGGDHRGGLRIVGENGPELEFTGPSRIMNAEMTRSVLGSRPPAAVSSPAPVIQLQPTLVNNTSREMTMEVQEVTDGRGQRQQKYVMSDAVATGMSAAGGKAARTMKSFYGLNRAGIAR